MRERGQKFDFSVGSRYGLGWQLCGEKSPMRERGEKRQRGESFGFRVSGFGFRVSGFGFRVSVFDNNHLSSSFALDLSN